jgi:hypothetical protein
MLKSVKMVLTEYYNALQPFIISDDEIQVGDMVCELLTTGQWLPMTIHTINDIDIHRQKKVIATSEQLGYVEYTEWHSNEFGVEEFNTFIRSLDLKDIEDILSNNGECSVLMEEYLGDYCGYREIKYLNNKVIIHLKK